MYNLVFSTKINYVTAGLLSASVSVAWLAELGSQMINAQTKWKKLKSHWTVKLVQSTVNDDWNGIVWHIDSLCCNVVAADDSVHAVCACPLLLLCCLFVKHTHRRCCRRLCSWLIVGHNIYFGKNDTINTSNSKVDLFSCETKSVKIYVLLWFD